MISLGGIVLSSDLILVGEFDDPVAGQIVETTLSGRRVIQKSTLSGKRTFILSAKSSGKQYYGYFTRTQILQLKELERANGTIQFIYGTASYNVLIAVGEIKVSPLLDYGEVFANEDLYTGTITLLEV